MRTTKTLACASLALILMAAPAVAQGVLNLPGYAVTGTHGPWDTGTLGSTIDITLSGVGAGFDVMDGTYPGWCAEDNFQANFPPGTLFFLLDTTDDPLNLPMTYQAVPWDQLNYLLNHRNGTVHDVQQAVWLITGTFQGTFGPATGAALAMAADAFANGGGYVPGVGEVVAVILYGDGLGPNGFQDTIIEVVVPGTGQGLTPGYWKNHPEDWPATGYSWTEDFDTTFGVDFFDPDITLGQAVWRRGGKLNRAARHGTAALLNVAHPNVNYSYTLAEVMALMASAQESDIDLLEAANELGCELP